jgi:hypothetical protein
MMQLCFQGSAGGFVIGGGEGVAELDYAIMAAASIVKKEHKRLYHEVGLLRVSELLQPVELLRAEELCVLCFQSRNALLQAWHLHSCAAHADVSVHPVSSLEQNKRASNGACCLSA